VNQIVVIKSGRVQCVAAPSPPDEHEQESVSQQARPTIILGQRRTDLSDGRHEDQVENNSIQVTRRSWCGSATQRRGGCARPGKFIRSVKDGAVPEYSLEYPWSPRTFKSVTIPQAIWLFPACVAAHFVEEATGFANWVSRNISTRYTEAHWRRIHASGLLFVVAAAASLAQWMLPVTTFLFTVLFLMPMVFNALFHAAASVYFRSYCPGTASALVLFPALCCYLVSKFSEAGLLAVPSALAAAVAGAAFHCVDLASTTFFLGRTPR